jgi:hypothetical protein
MAICKRVIEGHLWVDSGRSRPVSLAMPCARKGLLQPDLHAGRKVAVVATDGVAEIETCWWYYSYSPSMSLPV